jgi:hypothetical protein
MKSNRLNPALEGGYRIERELGEPGMAGQFEQGRPTRPGLNRSELIT